MRLAHLTRKPAIGLLACSMAFVPGGLAREAVVTGEDVTLRASCGAAGSLLARLPPGHKLKFRFAISGATSQCYSVTAEVDGKVLKGYVPKTAVSGLHEFERTRPQASSEQIVSRAMAAAGLPAPAATGSPRRNGAGRTSEQQQLLAQAIAEIQEGKLAAAERLLASYPALAQDQDAALLRSQALLQLSRPRDALNVADAALQNHSQNADLLAAAGLAAYRLDDVRRADYLLKLSLSLKHNSSIETVHQRIQREFKNDVSSERRQGARFLLRYEGSRLDDDAARKLTTTLERELTRISQQLGCTNTGQLVAIIQSRANYQATTGAADWSAGQYDGRIRIALRPGGTVDATVTRTIAHEIVHACLARLGRWPAWVHEGLAQKLSGASILPAARRALEQLGKDRALPKLEALSGGWSRYSRGQALVAYGLSLAAMEVFFEHYQSYGLRNLMRDPQQLPRLTEELDRWLEQRYQ